MRPNHDFVVDGRGDMSGGRQNGILVSACELSPTAFEFASDGRRVRYTKNFACRRVVPVIDRLFQLKWIARTAVWRMGRRRDFASIVASA